MKLNIYLPNLLKTRKIMTDDDFYDWYEAALCVSRYFLIQGQWNKKTQTNGYNYNVTENVFFHNAYW